MRGVLFFALALALCGNAQAKTLKAPTITPAATLDVSPRAPELPELAPVTLAFAAAEIAPPQILRGAQRLQCAVYARIRSGLDLRGLARSWWAQAPVPSFSPAPAKPAAASV